MVGIYKIENLINGKIYIGQSIDINRRWRRHKVDYKNELKECYNYPLYRAFRKYGIENFSFSIIEECDREQLDEREKFYIDRFDSFFNGYNLTLGGQSSSNNQEVFKSTIIGIIRDLETTNMLQKEIADKWDVNISTVNAINTGRAWNYNRKYPIQNSNSYIERLGKHKRNHVCIDCGKQITSGAERCTECNRKYHYGNLKKDSLTREHLKKLIRSESFTQIAKEYGVSDNAVRKWCDKFNLPRRAKEIKNYTDEEWNKI